MRPWKWVLVIVVLFLFGLLWPVHAGAGVVYQTFLLHTGTGSSGDTTNAGSADSSRICPTAKFQRCYLSFKASRPCRLAIMVKDVGGDSLSSLVPGTDSTKASVWGWGAEEDLAAAVGTGADSIVARPRNPYPTSVVAGSEEYVIEFNENGASKWGEPRMFGPLPIKRSNGGGWYWGARTQIRWRVLSAGGAVTVYGKLTGVAWE